MFELGCGARGSLSVPVRGKEKGLLAVLRAQIEGQMASPAPPLTATWLGLGGGAGVCVCVRVCRVGEEEVCRGRGAEQLIKHQIWF